MIQNISDYVCKTNLDYEYDSDYDQIREQIDFLASTFEGATEARGLPSADATATFFCDMLFNYEGVTLADCQMGELIETVENTIPRKMTMHKKSEAEEFIEELIQFWKYLGRQYNHPLNDQAVSYLESIRENFADWMFDPQKAGMAKSIFMDVPADFDFDSEESIEQYIMDYNNQIEGSQTKFLDFPVVRDTPKIGRNEQCPCGSGKKYKKCCGSKK